MEPAEAMATVLSCTYRPRVGRAVAFGLPARKHFLITYNYWAEGELHLGEMWSERPIPQGNVFPVQYDPEAPGRLWESAEGGAAGRVTGPMLLAIGVAGSVVLSLVWLLLMRGCG